MQKKNVTDGGYNILRLRCFNQNFHSPQVKWNGIISNNDIHELLHEFPNHLRLTILGD